MKTSETTKLKAWLWGLAIIGLLVALTVLAWGYLGRGFLGEYFERLSDLLKNPEKLRAWVESWGPWGPIFYILIQALQVVISPLPGETTAGLVSGFVFGPWLGFLYSIVGLTLGSFLGFLLGRWLGTRIIARFVSKDSLGRLKALLKRQGALAAILIFALPYFPKDYLCLALGMGGMPVKVFLATVMLGRSPLIFLFNLKGAFLYEGAYLTFFLLLAAYLTLVVSVIYWRESLYRWLENLGETGPENPSDLPHHQK
jgi:uncharacterized membrane protein YdjX (TVP38/TMEM64 family)